MEQQTYTTSSTVTIEQEQIGIPTFAYSLYEREDGQGTLAYKVLGRNSTSTATPLVLIHGLSSAGLVDWSPLVEKLSESRQVLIFDNRNIGGSTIPEARKDDEYTVNDMAGDVIALVKRVGWKEIDLLGFSMGGMIAQCLLVNPNKGFKVRHAVLAATSAKAAHSDLLSSIPTASAPINSLQAKIDLVKPFIYIGYDPSFVAAPKNAALLERRVMESVNSRRPQKTITKQLGVIAGYDVRSLLPTIPSTLPVLIIHGALDRSVYQSEQKYITDGIKHAQIALLPSNQIGHMWYDYFTQDFWCDLLNDFLDDQPARPIVPLTKARL